MFQQGAFDVLPEILNGRGYISMFLAGILFSSGFTAPFAVAIFIEMADRVDPIIGALIGGVGALLSDLTLFECARISFHDEIHRLKSTAIMQWLHRMIHHETVSEHLRMAILWSFGGLIIASPLPDELGIMFLSSVESVDRKLFMLLCLPLNTLGILVILLAAR